MALRHDALVLRQDNDEEEISLASVDGVDAAVNERRVRLRFRTVDGATWTICWLDGPTTRTALVLDVLRGL
jgi:hypothetical protein